MSKNIVGFIVVLVLVAGGSFYGGMTYGKSTRQSAGGNRNFQMGANGQFGNFNGQGGTRVRLGAGGAGITSGTVLSISGSTVTVQLGSENGGTKLVLISSSTPLSHMVEAPIAELKVGDRITVIGQADASGAVNAQSIQLRPASSTFFMGTQPPRE